MTKSLGGVGLHSWGALALLFVINFLNYLDRQVIFAVQVLIGKEFTLSDAQLGTLGTAFMVVYMAASPVTGYLADRFPRHWFISSGVALWSIATAAGAWTKNYWQLFATRAAVGIGEAGYATVSPSLISDLFPLKIRGAAMSLFYLALPLGSAMGIVLGGWLGAHYGWRMALLAVGLPGLLAAAAALWLPDPPRGAMDECVTEGKNCPKPTLRDYLGVLKIRSFVINTAGMAAYTFSMGGLVAWMPTYFVRERGMSLDSATFYFGMVTFIAGLAGTMAGGALGDWLQKRTPKAYFLLSGVSLALGAPCAMFGIVVKDPTLSWGLILLAEFFLFINTGPLNAALANVIPPSMRATGFALNIFIIHLLGDVPSPPLIGWISDRIGLTYAVLAAAVPMGLGSSIYFYGMTAYAEDVRKVSARE